MIGKSSNERQSSSYPGQASKEVENVHTVVLLHKIVQNISLCAAKRLTFFTAKIRVNIIYHNYVKKEQEETFAGIPENICWSWRRLQHVFNVTILRLSRRLEDVLKTSCKSWKTKNCYAEDVFKTSWRHFLKTCLEDIWRHVLKTSGRHCENKQNTYWRYLYLSYLNVYLTNLYFKSLSDNSKANHKCINKNSIISLFVSFWNSSSITVLRIKISDDWFSVVKSAEVKFNIAEKLKQ